MANTKTTAETDRSGSVDGTELLRIATTGANWKLSLANFVGSSYFLNGAYTFSGLGATTIADATQSTSSVTGSLKTAGGLGVAKNAFFGGNLTTATGGQFRGFNAGSLSAPAYSFVGSTNTGFDIYNSTLGFVGAGVFGGFLDQTGVFVKSTSQIAFLSGTTSASVQDTILTRAAAATLQLGAANAASPVAQTLQSQGSRPGTDTNVAGSNLTIASGQGTGNAAVSSLIFQTPAAVASGTGAQTQTTGLTIKNGVAVRTNYTVANLPTASTVQGGMAFVTDASTTIALGLGLTVVGGGANKVPVYSDGTNWIIG